MNNFLKVFRYNKFYWKGHIEPANLHNEGRKASWLELFVDLVFVAALGVLVHGLVENYNYLGLFITFVYFTLIWSSWNSITMYSHLFEQRGIIHRIIMFINIVASALILLPYNNEYHEYLLDDKLAITFIVAVFLSRFLMYFTWNNAYQKTYNKYLKKYLKARKKSYFVSMIITLVAIFLRQIFPIFLPITMLLISGQEIFFAYLYKDGQINRKSAKFFNIDHLVERFGLFSMLIIGESILAVINNIQGTSITFTELLILFVFILFIFLIWFLYYEVIMNRAVANIPKWKIANLLLHFSFILIATGININLHDIGHGMDNSLIVALIFYYISLMLIKNTLDLKETLEEHENLDESKLYRSMVIGNVLTIIVLLLLLFLAPPSIILVMLIINLCLIINIILYYYFYIKMMTDIMW